MDKANFERVIKQYLPNGTKIEYDSSISDTYNIDSISFIDIVIQFEDEFSITLPDSLLSDVKTFGDLKEYVEVAINA